jgi:hypothetical protein
MNRYILIRRLMGPSILLLLGVVALLHQAHLVHWNLFVPLLLILIGLFKLAERAALATEGDEAPFPGGYPGAPYPYPGAGAPQGGPQQGTSIVPVQPQDITKGPEGGQS